MTIYFLQILHLIFYHESFKLRMNLGGFMYQDLSRLRYRISVSHEVLSPYGMKKVAYSIIVVLFIF